MHAELINDPLMTTAQVSEITGVSAGTLQNWRCNGSQPGLKFIKVGRQVRYRQSAVVAFLDANEKGQTD